LILFFANLTSLTLITGWARVTVLDTDRYVDTVAELADELDSTQQAVRPFDNIVWFLPIVCLAILVAAITIAPRRWRAVRRTGIALAIAMVVVLALLFVVRSLYLDALGSDVPKDAAEAVFDVVTEPLKIGLIAGLVVGIVALAGAIFAERRSERQQAAGGVA